jgi:5'-3' exonuclease
LESLDNMIIVDGSGILHRVLNTPQGDLTDNLGRHVGGVHGFLLSVGSVARKYQLKHIIVIAWDLGIPLFRREIYPEYKHDKIPVGDVLDIYKSESNLLNRQGDSAPSKFLEKYVMSRRILHTALLSKMGGLSIQVENCEADDIIAYVCEKITDEEVIIVSTDRDLVQLLTDNRLFHDGRTGSAEILSESDVIQKYNLIPEYWQSHWLMARAIAGDTSDGIPGIPGIGLNTAIKYVRHLLEPFDPFELQNTLLRLERIKGVSQAAHNALKLGADIILRNWKLMDLSYPIRNKLPIVDHIRTQIASNFVYDFDPYGVEVELHEMNLIKAKSYASLIMESNSAHVARDYIEELT